MKKVVIVGAGYGGIEAALTLQRNVRRQDDVKITLIEKNGYHTLLTELHEVAGNRVEDDAIKVPLHHIFEYTDIEIVRDEVIAYDFDEKSVSSANRTYDYDYLVLSRGAEPAFYDVEGVERYSLTLWSSSDAVRVREHIQRVFQQAGREPNAKRRCALLTIVVVGGGFTGVELMGELMRWKTHLALENGLDEQEVRLVLVEGQDRICPAVNKSLGERVKKYMTDRGIQVLTGQFIKEAGPDYVIVGKETRIPTHTIIWAGGARGRSGLSETGIPLTKAGKIKVNEFLEVEGFPGVYAIGDNASFRPPGGKSELPGLVEGALQTGKQAALNILRELRGKTRQPCKPKLHGVMISVGRWFGVADIMGWKLTGLWAILMKHIVNMHYLFGIGGFELIFRYLRHEFLSPPLGVQGTFERQFTRQRPLFFLVPLRLYLGYMWLVEGLKKLQEGWWTNIVLGEVTFGGVGQTALPLPPVDAVTTATSLSLITETTPDWYAWIVRTFVYPNALLFQRVVLLSEIALGLAFLAGLFTTVAAFVSIVLNINFLLSTGLYDYWYLVASLVMFAGAGSVWGLDYFVMPYLMRQWRYFVRRRRLGWLPIKG